MEWNSVLVLLHQITAGGQLRKIPLLFSPHSNNPARNVLSDGNTNIPEVRKLGYAALESNFKFKHHLIINGCHRRWRGSLQDSAFICCSQNSLRKLPLGKVGSIILDCAARVSARCVSNSGSKVTLLLSYNAWIRLLTFSFIYDSNNIDTQTPASVNRTGSCLRLRSMIVSTVKPLLKDTSEM